MTSVDASIAMRRGRVTAPEGDLDEGDEADPAVAGGSGTSAGQGLLKHLLTRLLLWTIRMEEPARFNLSQALVLVGRSLRSDYGFLLRPIQREIILRWQIAREDWRKSGDAASKQKLRKRAPGYVAKEK